MGQADRPGSAVPYVTGLAVDKVLSEVFDMVVIAMSKHAPMHSPHEGHSVLREEFEELWEHVKADTGRSPEARKEALQVAAMAVRYILDLIDGDDRASMDRL